MARAKLKLELCERVKDCSPGVATYGSFASEIIKAAESLQLERREEVKKLLGKVHRELAEVDNLLGETGSIKDRRVFPRAYEPLEKAGSALERAVDLLGK